MSTGSISLNGIKREASKLKKAAHIKHHEALNIVAKRHGFQNYHHAQNQLKEK